MDSLDPFSSTTKLLLLIVDPACFDSNEHLELLLELFRADVCDSNEHLELLLELFRADVCRDRDLLSCCNEADLAAGDGCRGPGFPPSSCVDESTAST